MAGGAAAPRRRGLTPAAQEVLEAAGRLAGEAAGARHVACVLFCQHQLGPRVAGATCCTDTAILRRDVQRCAALSASEASQAGLEDDMEAFVQLALAQREAGTGPVNVGNLLLALFEPALQLEPILAHSGLAVSDVRRQLPKALRAVRLYSKQAADLAAALPSPPEAVVRHALPLEPERQEYRQQPAIGLTQAHKPDLSPHDKAELAELAELAPRSARRAATQGRTALSACGVDLVAEALAGHLDPVLGRDAEVSRVLQVLARRTKSNCCLVGAPGVGKTALVEGVAQRIAAGEVPPQLRNCRELWSLDVGALLAGTGLRGDFEERLQALLAEARAAASELVLFVDELHLLVGAGRSEGNTMDAANLLKPVLARGEVRCIGATTSEEYRRLILQGDAAFERRFQVVEVAEPSAEAAAEMLRGLLPRYAEHHRLRADAGVAEAAVALSRGLRGRSLPDRAIDLLDEACAFAAEAGAEELRAEHLRAVLRRCGPAPGPPQAATFSSPLEWLRQRWSRL